MTKDRLPAVRDVLSGENTIYLATLDGNQPRVRPVTLVEHKGDLFVLTGMKDAKVSQILKHKKVEIVVPVKHGDNTGYVRFTALATIERNSEQRARAAKVASFFSQFWDSPDNPDYALLRIQPVKIEYLKPGDLLPTPIEKLDFNE
jgi:general stress protein 26